MFGLDMVSWRDSWWGRGVFEIDAQAISTCEIAVAVSRLDP